MDSLPAEICGNICEYVDSNVDLKSLSLLNRGWAAVTRPHLFRRIHVVPWPDCLERLEQSLEKVLGRSRDHELHVHLPYMPDFPSSLDTVPRMQAAFGSRFTGQEPWLRGSQAAPQDDVTHSTELTEKDWIDLLFYHRKDVSRYNQGISSLLRGTIWKALKDGIGRPFQRIVIDAGDIWTGHAEPWSMLQDNCTEPARIDSRFSMLATSMETAGLFDGAQEVNFRRLPPQTFSDASSRRISIPSKIMELSDRVSVTFALSNFDSERPSLMRGYSPYMNTFPGSRTLPDSAKDTLKDYSVQGYSKRGAVVYLPAEIHLPPWYERCTLQRLSLGGLRLRFRNVQSMLDNVRDTLECLELRDISIFDHGPSPSSKYPATCDFFCALVTNHRLKEAEFRVRIGVYKDGCNLEKEIVSEPFELRHQNERAILGQQVARAVVVEPSHRCFYEKQPTENRVLPTKEERLKWLREAFDKNKVSAFRNDVL